MLAGYPRSHLEAVSDFLSGQFQQDAVGPLLGSTEGGSSSSRGGGGGVAAPAAAGSGSSGGSMLHMVMEVLGRQALVQAADSTAASPTGGSAAAAAVLDGGSGSGTSIAQLLAGLDAACSAAFDGTSAVVSPTLAVTGSLSLGPSPSGLSLAYIPTSSEAANASLVAAAAWEGQQHVLLLRSAGGSGGGQQEGCEAAVLLLPGGDSVTDLALYKEGRLALLLAGATCRLALLPPDALQWVQLPPDLLAEADALQLAQMLLESAGCGSGTAWPEEAARQRVLPYPRAQAPLAVSASRGVGCVLAGTQASAEGVDAECQGQGAQWSVAHVWCVVACWAALCPVQFRPNLALIFDSSARFPCCRSEWCCMTWKRTRQKRRTRRRKRVWERQLQGRTAWRATTRRQRAACEELTAELSASQAQPDRHMRQVCCAAALDNALIPIPTNHAHKCTCKSCALAGKCLHQDCTLTVVKQ